MDRWKSRDGRVREEKKRREKIREEKESEERRRRCAIHCVFPMICGSEGRKVSSLKRWVRSHVARCEMKHCSTFPGQNVPGLDDFLHAVVAQSTFGSQNVESTPGSDHFWKLRCRKSHAVVARSTFRSQKCKKLTGSEHFWTFRCRFAWQAQGIMHLAKNEQNL